jgi:integrase
MATVKAYCKIAHDARVISTPEYVRIKGVESIPHRKAVNIDKKRTITRRTHAGHATVKKAQATVIPDELLPALKFPETGFLAARDSLLMCLLLDHALRVGEVAILKKAQIDLDYIWIDPEDSTNIRRGSLTFDRPKVDKDKIFAIFTPDTYAAAMAYLPTLPAEQESLFDLAVTSIQERVRMIGRKAGIDTLSPHDCRHSAATRAAHNGATLQELMEFGGWTNAQTAIRYLKRQEISNKNIRL